MLIEIEHDRYPPGLRPWHRTWRNCWLRDDKSGYVNKFWCRWLGLSLTVKWGRPAEPTIGGAAW